MKLDRLISILTDISIDQGNDLEVVIQLGTDDDIDLESVAIGPDSCASEGCTHVYLEGPYRA